MTTLSIEDLRIGTTTGRDTDGTVLRPTVAGDGHPDLECGRGQDREAILAHIAKCDPATIAALIEGYIAMAEAIEKARIALAEYACHSGEPCARTPEQCRDWCGKAAGDAILIVDATLNIGGTND